MEYKFTHKRSAKQLWLTYAIQILNKSGNFLVLYKEIVATWNIFHDMPFNFLILQYCKSIVNENRWRCCFEVRSVT